MHPVVAGLLTVLLVVQSLETFGQAHRLGQETGQNLSVKNRGEYKQQPLTPNPSPREGEGSK